MSNRREAGGRRGISGPQSALTDFLAANNISARDIRDRAGQRIAANAAQNEALQTDEVDNAAEATTQSPGQDEPATNAGRGNNRKRKSKTALKAAAKKKAKRDNSDDDFSDDEDEDDFSLGPRMNKKAKAPPGQIENCELCDKRFTVTPYTKEGPSGGLLCTPCGKIHTKDSKAADAKAKRAAAGAGKKRRQKESRRLDGVVGLGPRRLVDICIERIAQHHGDLDELGDLPDNLVDRLCQIFSRKRVLTPQNFKLFLRPDMETVAIHDAANLNESDFQQMFAIAPDCTKVVLRNAGQFKDSCVDYMIEKAPKITHLQFYAANLVTNSAWTRLFKAYGPQLETVAITWCDASFTDANIEALVENCCMLRRLKIKHCRQVSTASLSSITRLEHLEHLSIRPSASPESEELMPILEKLGPQLKTLSLDNCPEIDDAFVAQIGMRCSKLEKLRLAGVECTSDAALAALFSASDAKAKTVLPPLRVVDFSGCRDAVAGDNKANDNADDTPADNTVEDDQDAAADNDFVGVASDAFRALMAHSGSKLKSLDISSCRQISHAAFCDVFNRDNGATYPALEQVNLAFCTEVNDAVVRGIFACCPRLQKVIAFGCFHVGDVVVPQGIALIGVPRAQDAIEKIGENGVDLEKALAF